jgi:hypothetical protein
MSDCLDKLKAIKKMAQEGLQGCNNQTERHRFEQISMEISYLINEAGADGLNKEDS